MILKGETNEEKIQKFLTSKYEPMHQLKSLNHIGFELLLTLIFNSQYQNLNDKILKFSCGNFYKNSNLISNALK